MDTEYSDAFVTVFSFVGAVVGAVGFLVAVLRGDAPSCVIACAGATLCAWNWVHDMAMPARRPSD